MKDDAFFVGWAPRAPVGLRGFLASLVVAVLGTAALLALLLSARIDDPGGGQFDWAAGEQTLHGLLTASPYPLLQLPDGHTVLLAGEGKTGPDFDPALAGRMVAASGIMLHRGTIEMLMVGDDPGLHAAAGGQAPPPPVALGRWRLVGEICDGKCWIGAMRPGSGIAHRACASLCLIGGLPPVLVTVAPVAGSSFLLLAGPDGGPMPEALRRLVGLRIRLDGTIERRGDVLVLCADPASARVL
ncbi:MAG: hypothetical protein P4M09_05745 [Devosia sp.]|nr:hypothetical protein [Devosia sp.]